MITPTVFLPAMNHVLQTTSRADYFSGLLKVNAKYGGMDVSNAQRLRAPEGENGKLKRLLADAMHDNVVLRDLLGKP
jgi:hypothetical protein